MRCLKGEFTVRVSFLFVVFLFINCTTSFANEIRFEQYVSDNSVEQPTCLYHWGSSKSVRKFVKFKNWSWWASYWLSGDDTQTMGKGLYVSADPLDSTMYGEKLLFVCQSENPLRFFDMHSGEDKTYYFQMLNELAGFGYDGSQDLSQLFNALRKLGISGVTNFTHSTWSVIFKPEASVKLLDFDSFFEFARHNIEFMQEMSDEGFEKLVSAISRSEGAVRAQEFRQFFENLRVTSARLGSVHSYPIHSCSSLFKR